MIVKQARQDSALVRSILGTDHHWNLQNQLLATVADALRFANWQHAGDKRIPQPEPIPRPGLQKKHAKAPVSIEEMRERLRRKQEMSRIPSNP